MSIIPSNGIAQVLVAAADGNADPGPGPAIFVEDIANDFIAMISFVI